MLNDKQAAALKRVIKKLSAMRQTLTKAERQVLDLLIVGATTEVSGHAMYDSRLAKKDPGMASVNAAMAQPAAEVMAHSMTTQAAANVQSAAQTSAAVSSAVQSSVAASVHEAVAFNAATNGYMVTFK